MKMPLQVIDKTNPLPLYIQLEKMLRERISRELGQDEPLGTIGEIAKTYGVSAITVKHTLYRMAEAGIVKSIKGRGYFVLKAPSAKSPAKVIAFSVFRGDRSILNPMYARIFEGAESVLLKNGFAISLYSQEEVMSNSLRQNSDFMGFIIVGLRNRMLHDSLFASNAKFVLADISSTVYPSVLTDNKMGARIAIEYLLKLGHKNIAIVNGSMEDETYVARFEGYKEVLNENGIKMEKEMIINDFRIPPNEKQEAIKNLLKKSSPPSAIFFSSDSHAVYYIPKILNMGIKIPQDISVIGYDDTEEAFYMKPPLTTIKQPMFEVGRKAAEILLNTHKELSTESSIKSFFLKPELIIRKSCNEITKDHKK